MLPINIIHPFLYTFDLIKDALQLALLIYSVGGLTLFLENWSSFSSTVSKDLTIHNNLDFKKKLYTYNIHEFTI